MNDDKDDENIRKAAEKENPEESANVFSRIFFYWIFGVLWKGYKEPLQKSDIFKCHKDRRAEKIVNSLEREWEMEARKQKASLGKALIRVHWKILAVIVLCSFFEAGCFIAPTILVAKVSSFFEADTTLTRDEALFYGLGLFLTNWSYVTLRGYLYWTIMRLGADFQTGLSCLIYKKVCRVSLSDFGKTSVGHIVTLISNDTQRFTDNLVALHIIVVLPLILITTFVLCYLKLGIYATLAGFAVSGIFIPIQSHIGKLVARCRKEAAPKTDQRVRLIGDVISSIKAIKMYNWEDIFEKKITEIREREMKFIGRFVLLGVSTNVIQNVIPVLGLLAVVGTLRLANTTITTEMVYFFMSMSMLIKTYVNNWLGRTFQILPQMSHSIKRIQRFMELPEQQSEHSTREDLPLEMVGVASRWTSAAEEGFQLVDLNLRLSPGTVTGIIGAVGSGKSSLILTIIKEMEITSGQVRCGEATGYCSQSPWLFNGTIQENILFNRPLDNARLSEVLFCCALLADIEQLPHGLDTLVGERGVQLSGGQKARVALARTVYGTEEILLLDDPFSALDVKSTKHVFKRLIKGFLKGRTVLLATHNTYHLKDLDYIYCLERDRLTTRVSQHGTWPDLVERGVLSPVQTDDLAAEASQDAEKGTVVEVSPSAMREQSEGRKTGAVARRLHAKFWSLGFGCLTLPLILLLVAITQATKVVQEQLLLGWVNDRVESVFNLCIGLAAAACLLYTIVINFIAVASTKSSTILHNMAFHCLIKSPLYFFESTPIGVFLNRFSKDTYFMDELMGNVFSQFTIMIAPFIASMVVVCLANAYFILVLLPFLGIIFFLAVFYLRTSVEVRRLEAMERSPVMSHISMTLNGISVIRASRQVSFYQERYCQLKDRHTSALLMFKVTGRWLSIHLDMLITLIGALATFVCVSFRDALGVSVAGLALVYIQNRLGQFQWCVRQGAEYENLMTAIERVYSLVQLSPEEPEGGKKKEEIIVNPSSRQGELEFRDVSLRYSEDLPVVLKGVSFTIKPGERIGIVGRTGAGKSSIFRALFRLSEVKGVIAIDGIDTATMRLSELRDLLSVIPQDSLLFTGTLRQNLDPGETIDDSKLWDALEQVQLKETVTVKGGLDIAVEEGGCNLSVGERQLLCLARALLRPSIILAVDEGTANVDEETDKAIQKTIREKFQDRTVLTVAHRLDTVIDSDRILIMDEGRVLEFDTPQTLLSNNNSTFYSLINNQ